MEPIDIDPQCIGCAWVFTDRPGTQSPCRLKQREASQKHQHKSQIGDHAFVEKHFSQAEQKTRALGKRIGNEDWNARHNLIANVQEARDARRENVNHRPADNLVHFVANREHGVKQCQQRATQEGRADAKYKPYWHRCKKFRRSGLAQKYIRHISDKRPPQHHAFDANVNYARAFADNST